MGDLSHRFTRDEFACPCTCGFSTVDSELITILDKTADYFLHKNTSAIRVAVNINSGARCFIYDIQLKEKLASVKGELYIPSGKKSEHIKGWATDFWMEWVNIKGGRQRIPDNHITDYLENKYPNTYGIGRYNGRTHLDMRPNKARWDNRG